jgi:hypothetical protein
MKAEDIESIRAVVEAARELIRRHDTECLSRNPHESVAVEKLRHAVNRAGNIIAEGNVKCSS